jgi:hypothetical protein
MRNLLALFGLAVILFLGLGWYLNWYSFRAVAPAEPGRKTYTIDINTKKISEDVRQKIREGEERLHDFFDNEPDRAGVPAEKKPGPDGSKAPSPRTGLGEVETAEPKWPGYPGR